MDGDIYYCNGTYGNDQFFEESVNITVRGKSVMYIRLPNCERAVESHAAYESLVLCRTNRYGSVGVSTCLFQVSRSSK